MTTPVTDLAALLLPSQKPVRPDNADPHPVILTVHPRNLMEGPSGCTPQEWEAEYEVDVEHPTTCPGTVEECPVADYLDVIGIDTDLYAGFPQPGSLTNEDLAVLDSTVRYVTITRTYSHSCGPNGDDWDVEYDFTWSDQ